MKSLNEFLATHGNLMDHLTPPTTLYDISRLTEEEKRYHIEYALEQTKTRYIRRMQSIGVPANYIQEKFDEIDWNTKIDVDEVLKNAAARKYWYEERLKSENEQIAREEQKRVNLALKYSPYYFREMIRDYFVRKHGVYIENEPYKKYVEQLCNFMNNPGHRGLLVIGNSGTGKTETLLAVAKNELRPFHVVPMLSINERVKAGDFVELNPALNYVIDDMGSEATPVKFYGTELNWFKDFVETVYLNRKNWSNLIITTNLGGDRIEEKYGARVRSRMREMFSVINLNGNDLRK